MVNGLDAGFADILIVWLVHLDGTKVDTGVPNPLCLCITVRKTNWF